MELEGVEKVTTNVLSQGINVEQVTLVVNFDMPIDTDGVADYETYLCRIGRTGFAINLIDSSESMQICQAIEKHFGKKIHLLDTRDVDEIEKILG